MMQCVLSLSVAMLSCCPSPLPETVGGVELPDALLVGDVQLSCNGVGLRTKTVFRVRVYAAALYLHEASSDPKKIIASQQPRALLLHFLRDVAGEDLRESIRIQFRKLKNYSALEERIDSLCSRLPDMKKGQQIRLIADQQQLVMFVDQAQQVTISGQDFCNAVFEIYLGGTPVEPQLRKALLNLDQE